MDPSTTQQIEELTKQLNASKNAEKQANERLLMFKREQLEQMHRILNMLTTFDSSEQTILSTSTDDLLNQIIAEYSKQNEEKIKLQNDYLTLKTAYQKEHQLHEHFEQQFNQTNKLIEMDHSKRIQKLRNYATLADDEGDILLSSLMKKADKNDSDFHVMKLQFEHEYLDLVNQIKKFIKERELLHLYIKRLEQENFSLAGRTNNDETIRLLTYSEQIPTSFQECLDLIRHLREQIIEQLKVEDKLRYDINYLQQTHQTDMREREQIEGLLNQDLTSAKDQIIVLESIRSEYEHVLKVKLRLEKEVDECMNELNSMRSVTNSLITQLKEKTEQLSLEKEKLEEDNQSLREQIQQLKIDFENSESVQHDFVKLSQTLQVQLEEFRNSQHELRWRSEDDFSECQKCHSPFSVTWRKNHCRHCGKVLCKDCLNRTIYTGSNNRAARVCNICFTLLDKTVQPYFRTNVPNI